MVFDLTVLSNAFYSEAQFLSTVFSYCVWSTKINVLRLPSDRIFPRLNSHYQTYPLRISIPYWKKQVILNLDKAFESHPYIDGVPDPLSFKKRRDFLLATGNGLPTATGSCISFILEYYKMATPPNRPSIGYFGRPKRPDRDLTFPIFAIRPLRDWSISNAAVLLDLLSVQPGLGRVRTENEERTLTTKYPRTGVGTHCGKMSTSRKRRKERLTEQGIEAAGPPARIQLTLLLVFLISKPIDSITASSIHQKHVTLFYHRWTWL
ncbi:hypothetical protein ACRALDRAFT_212352 [Sodiomyces alcalophilus JCM 7366]|uniref:uncharacterized protein n=1 Tax=Sodiomyces alcalophilus JCM 7366 TaxID=591952 RepID=UPI0039B6E71D